MARLALTAVILCSLTAGCTTVRETAPERTATEQLLLSTAVDRAVRSLDLDLPEGTRIYINERYFEAFDEAYALGAIRDALLRNGYKLVTQRSRAEVVVEPRAGALSTDKRRRFVGLPSFAVPIPLAGQLETPEIALFKSERQHGVAKIAVTGYDAQSGALQDATGPLYGDARHTRWLVLVVGWTTSDLREEKRARPPRAVPEH